MVKKNKNEDKICTNCFRERILINPHNIDEKNELQKENNEKKLYEDKGNIIENNEKNENKSPNPMMLVIGLIPFVLLFFTATAVCFSDFPSFWKNNSLFEIFIFIFIVGFITFSPVFICSIVLIISYIISYIKYARKKN